MTTGFPSTSLRTIAAIAAFALLVALAPAAAANGRVALLIGNNAYPSSPLRNAVNLVYFGGMKYRDAAKVMSVPVGTVKSRLHAAIQRLGQSWRDVQPASRS